MEGSSRDFQNIFKKSHLFAHPKTLPLLSFFPKPFSSLFLNHFSKIREEHLLSTFVPFNYRFGMFRNSTSQAPPLLRLKALYC
ncbi:hypothetical protein ES332_A10G097700v1 [Gossypium tomentosum]|uniref:Uncharacterized protein n=1 Tax=Gossypium tomentosum TaxID=34277 RepID=A0A5D2NMZ8_GOSTO|nr:hypothetical protein ES332_A10G097700v1 [Gossypium tomentosum]